MRLDASRVLGRVTRIGGLCAVIATEYPDRLIGTPHPLVAGLFAVLLFNLVAETSLLATVRDRAVLQRRASELPLGVLIGSLLDLSVVASVVLRPHTPWWWVAGWLAGAAVDVLIPTLGMAIIARRGRRFQPAAEPRALAAAANLSQRLDRPVLILHDRYEGLQGDNAAALGTGRAIRVVMTASQRCRPDDEVLATLAHEAAHVTQRHVLRLGALNLGISLLVWALIRTMDVHVAQVGRLEPGTFCLFTLTLLSLASWLDILTPRVERQFEYEADRVGALTTGDAAAAARSLVRSSSCGSSTDPDSSEMFSRLRARHPPVGQRLTRLADLEKAIKPNSARAD